MGKEILMNTDRRKFIKNGSMALAGVMAMSTSSTMKTASAEQPQTDSQIRTLSGKAAIITGARNNIGRAIAIELARLGADVVVHHHTPDTRDQAEETARLVREKGGRAVISVGDLGEVKNMQMLFDVAEKEFGHVDIFVHNAGRLRKMPLVELSDEEYILMQRINVDATFYGLRESARRLRDNGRIITVGTTITASPPAQYGVYGSGKSFMNHLVKTVAKEVGNRGITVNSINPGPIDTPFFHSQETPQSVAFVQRLAPLGRIGTVEEVAPIVGHIASPEAQWINGETIYINGGYTEA